MQEAEKAKGATFIGPDPEVAKLKEGIKNVEKKLGLKKEATTAAAAAPPKVAAKPKAIPASGSGFNGSFKNQASKANHIQPQLLLSTEMRQDIHNRSKRDVFIFYPS